MPKREDIKSLCRELQELAAGEPAMSVMEVCGTHTMAIARHGIKDLLPRNLRLVSGPGCPVCVTSQGDIEQVIAAALQEDMVLATFGDMMDVPGKKGSLIGARAKGAEVRVIYSPLEALSLAESTGRQVVLLGIGFETTAPLSAALLLMAKERGIDNLTLLSQHKLLPPALSALFEKGFSIKGLLLPGHVSAVIGEEPYRFIPRRFGLGGVISGFSPSDILASLVMMLSQLKRGLPDIEVQYRKVVRRRGNPEALKVMEEVLEPVDACWRGLGVISGSGLEVKEDYAAFDARKRFGLPAAGEDKELKAGCICAQVIQGKKEPGHCGLLGKECTPQSPCGPCMVSSEGACSAHFLYGESPALVRGEKRPGELSHAC